MALDANGNYTSLADAGYTRDQIVNWFNELAAKTGSPINQGDVDLLIAKLTSGSGYMTVHGGDPRRAFAEFEEQYYRRSDNDAPDSSSYAPVGTTKAALDAAQVPYSRYAPQPAYTPMAAAAPTADALGSAAVFGPGVSAQMTTGPVGLMTPSATMFPGGGGYAPSTGLQGASYGGGSMAGPSFFGLDFMTLALLGAAGVAIFLLVRK